MAEEGRNMGFSDPAFWRAGAISMIAVMSVVLISGIGTQEAWQLRWQGYAY
jgi:hypothetical protein